MSILNPGRSVPLAILLFVAAAQPTMAQTSADECETMIETWTQAYLVNIYDDLSRLEEGVEDLIANLRNEQPLTEEQLSQMTVEQIKNNAKLIQTMRDCLPGLIDLVRQIRDRIDSLQGMANTSVAQNRRGTPRGRLIDDLLEDQEDLRDAVNAALRRAGVRGESPAIP
ncbi:MAG: hypothetical protein AAF389_14165 [Gemmatimonadota bacterium]